MVAPVYDKEKVEDTDGPVVGKNSADKYAEEPKALDAEELRNAEAAGTDKSGSVQEEGEEADFIYRDEGKKGTAKKRITKRKKLLGVGATGGIVGIVFFIFTIASGPLQFIHFAQLLQKFHFSNNEELGNGRTYRYFRSLNRGGRGYAKMQTRLGTIGNKIADNMEVKLQREGLRSVYDISTGNLIAYQFLEDSGSRTRAGALISNSGLDPNTDIETSPVSSKGDRGRDSTGKPLGTGDLIDLEKSEGAKKLIDRRKVGKGITKALGLSKVASAVGFRATAKRNGTDLHPLRRLDRRVDESITNYSRRIKDAFREKFKNGVKPPVDVKLENDTEPGPSRQAETEGRTTQAEAKADPKTTKSNLATKIGLGASLVGVLCAARSISENIETVKYSNIILPMMRMGTNVVAVGNQVMSGDDVSIDELGVLSKDLYDSEKKLGWTSAKSIQAELGEPQTGLDIPPTAKPSRAGEKPVVLSVIDDIFDTVKGGGEAACSTIGQTLLDALSGGLISGVVTDIIGRAASAAGVNPLDTLIGWLVDVLAGDEVNTNATGPDLGNIANYGARLAANDQALSMGGAKLSNVEVAELDAESREASRNELKQKSFFARVFDINEPGSVLAKAAFENPNLASMQTIINSSVSSSLNVLTNLGGTFANILAKRVGAQTTLNYEYGFDEYGFSRDLQEDERFEDPYENALFVENQLEKLNSDYDKCFTMKVNPSTFKLEMDITDRYEEPEQKCNDPNDISLIRYRFYLLDSIVGNAIACYEVEDAESCGNVGFGEGNTSGVATSSTATGQIDVSALGESSASIACAVDTTDKGVIQSKYEGEFRKSNPLMIRLCQIPNLPGEGVDSTGTKVGGGAIVNSRVSAAWSELAKAAKAAGVSLTASSSFRLNNSCGGTGDGTACAQPGKSPHQLGVAIDFQNMGEKGGSSTSCTGRKTAVGNAGWDWLSKNAERFGLKQYSYEPWHWDPMPLANRCGTI